MKNVLFIAIFCCYTLSLSSQVVSAKSGKMPAATSNSKENETEKETFNATIRCYYAFKQINEKTGQLIRVDTMSLLIGDNQSKFFNPTKHVRDSTVFSLMNNSNIKTLSVIKDSNPDLSTYPGTTMSSNSNDGETYQIFKDRTKNTLTYIDYFSTPSKYKYTDNLSDLSWSISQDTLSVLGYSCQKATADFRGRKFTAWFTKEVPINDGPWKFMGLPGLILKINDTADLFSFTLIGIENIDEPLQIKISEAKFDCNRKQFAGMKKKQSAGMQINLNGGDMTITDVPGTYNYNPIELDN